MSNAIKTNEKHWPCGCETWREGDKAYIQPCSTSCAVFHAVIHLSQEQGNPVRTESALRSSVSCSHCHTMNDEGEKFCKECGHRADLPRLQCDCDRCTPEFGVWHNR